MIKFRPRRVKGKNIISPEKTNDGRVLLRSESGKGQVTTSKTQLVNQAITEERYAEIYTFGGSDNFTLFTEYTSLPSVLAWLRHVCIFSSVSLTPTSDLTYCERTSLKPTGCGRFDFATAQD